MKLLGSIMKTAIPVLLLLFAHTLLTPPPAQADAKAVLILHGYNQGNEWTDSTMQGMMSVFNDSGMELDIHVEYMDTVHHPSEAYLDLLDHYYQEKYGRYHLDAILLSDRPALLFLLPRQDRLFPGVPVIFCGVKNYQTAQILGQTGITGIIEDIDIKGTIDLALRLDPDIEEFLVINDRSATGLANREEFENAMAAFHSEPPVFELFDDFTVTELKTRLSALPDHAAVLVMRLPTDELSDPEQYLNLISEYSRAPLYTLWSVDVGKGFIGGVVVDGFHQGELAARYTLRVLKGEDAASIPVELQSSNVTMVDYRQLKKFGFSEKALPEKTQILFKPETVFDKYRYQILSTAFVVAILMVIIVFLFANIIIRRKTEKALLESEEKLSTALGIAHLGHWEYDPVSDLFTFNDQFYAIFRTTAQEVGGYTMTSDEYARRFIHPDDRHLVNEEVSVAIETSDPYYNRRIEHRMRYADGTIGYMAVRYFNVKNAQGQTVRVYGVNQDITDVRQAEESILKSEERWRMFLQTAMDGFNLADTDGRIIEVNDTFCRMLGYSREELLGMRVSELVAGRTQDHIQEHIRKIIAKGEDRFEARHRRKDGEIIDTEVSVQYRPVEGGLLCSFLRDVTERKQIESRLQQSQKMEAVGTLAGGIAHDFNNILQPMLGFCELLQDDLPPNCPEQKFVDGIQKSALRAKELVHQILSFSRQNDEEAKPTRLQPLIKEAMKLLRSSIPKTIDIEQDVDPDCGVVFADPTYIYQIVMNLCTNAYQAMEDSGGSLKLALTQAHLEKYNPVFPEMVPGDYALLKVSDTGVGIPGTVMNRIFDPYFTTKKKGKGTGLGLSIVQGIVRRHNGDIRIYSEPGKGTEIHVYLPIMEQGESNAAASLNSQIPGGSERILLVDDEEPVADMIRQMLERLGYRVTPRIGSLEALETFQLSPDDFDLVITDLTMPHMTGVQLAGEMKQIRKDIPVILCTGFSEQAANDKLDAVGIQAKLAKPVITRDLAEAVREVLTKANRDQ